VGRRWARYAGSNALCQLRGRCLRTSSRQGGRLITGRPWSLQGAQEGRGGRRFSRPFSQNESSETVERGNILMFVGRTSKIVTALGTVVGIVALVGIEVLALTDGSEYTEFVLVMIFFVAFLVGSYWWIVFGPGRYL
jgi:hypothetical protein